MSITSAFNASRSGLSAAAARAGLTSTNIANSGRASYVRRDMTMVGSSDNQGVTITAIKRDVDASLQARQRQAAALAGFEQGRAEGLALYTRTLGEPGDGSTLPDRVSKLQTSFDLLSSEPADTNAQKAVVRAGEALARSLNESARALTAARADAYEVIGSEISEANTLLGEIERLNERLDGSETGAAATAGLQDERDAALDRLSEIVDIEVRARGARVDVYAGGGAPLIEGREIAPLSYDPGSGVLTAGAVDVTPGRPGGRGFAAGSLGAALTLHDATLPEMGRQLDALASRLVLAFEDADASRSPGAPGFFTDAGAAFSAPDGLAGRIAVNIAVRPEAGGQIRRVRDGMEGVPGNVAETGQILAFVAALETPQSFDPQAGLGTDMSLGEYAATLVGEQAGATARAKAAAEAETATLSAIAVQRSETEGVNVDDELQKLLQIEQSYAANSQVITALTRMMDSLLAAV
ncbi:flagellar hook-associated protein FlgK [Roseivivax sp. CAU 1761]